ncbi:FRG domain-containing protein [Verrucomicrobium sp. BvORR106]|uniref:FRG domain-containing protein n=1 Tax=Verrucomicrobium sp. BvORR106 TaxID=1403819 RepID=UPI000A528E1B|nr:FRG domain-containing protein [Verrucomicrobium sp. BvORR106]
MGMASKGIKTVAVESWSELQDLLFDQTWNREIKRWRSTFAYRGLDDASFQLNNSLSRLGEPYENMEKNLLKQFKKYGHRDLVERDTDWHWLSVAQHHGLPTRLLDWTYSPMVALHFATADLSKFHLDGSIWKVNFADVHALLMSHLTAALDSLGAKIFTVDTLYDTLKTTEELDRLHKPQDDAVIFFEPPSIDDRIVNQFAYFSVMSDPTLTMNEWLARPQVAGKVDAVKIVIPSGLKWEVRDKLDQSNITERVLMPGLDGLCKWLARHYKPRG